MNKKIGFKKIVVAPQQNGIFFDFYGIYYNKMSLRKRLLFSIQLNFQSAQTIAISYQKNRLSLRIAYDRLRLLQNLPRLPLYFSEQMQLNVKIV